MKQKWKKEQFIEISASELFTWWDWLDSLKEEPEKAFDLFTQFLEQCEDQLEIEWCCEETLCNCDGNKKKLSKNEQLDIPFQPRHSF